MNDLFGRIANLGIRRPWAVIGACLVFLVVCGALAATLRVDSSRHTMVSENNPHQALQMRYFERFGLPNAMIAVIAGGEPETRRMVADAMVSELTAIDELRDRVVAQVSLSNMAELLYLNPNLQPPSGVDARGYLQSDNGELHYVLVFPELAGTQQAHEVRPMVEMVRAARDVALATVATGTNPVTADLTGPAVLVVDEELEIQRGILTTSGVTGLAILLLLWLAFRSVRYTLLAILPVAIGVTGTMAVARVIYGDLNMVTSSCSSILLGLGIDSGVFLLTRYGEVLRGNIEVRAAIGATLRRSGKALVIGAVTTAMAFLTTTTTEFTAYARLGVIVAVGLVLMVATTLLLLPALLEVTERRTSHTPPQLRVIRFLPGLLRRVPVLIVLSGVIALVVSLTQVGTLRFNTRFYDFIPEHVEGARALLAIEHDTQVSPLRATVSVEGIEPARELAARLRALPTVAAVQSPTDVLPPLDIAALRARLGVAPADDAPEAVRRGWAAASTIADRGAYLPTDLPALLQLQFVSLDGSAIGLQVLPRGDIWNPAVAAEFARTVRDVAPEATGMAMHIEAHLRFIREGFTRAAIAAALLMLLIVAVAFRSLADAALALLPSAVGFVWLLGLLALFAIPFDAANIVVLPLILGIGVDAGVHLIERVRQSEHEHGRAVLREVIEGTGSAVLVASATTMAGFAALMLADYGAMQSLGLVMTLGIACCTVASLVLLPALLLILRRAT